MKKITLFLFLFASILANAQSFTLKGKVVDEDNNPLPGATVLVMESNKGTSTDFNGEFQIQFPVGEHLIQVRFIGFKSITKAVTISNKDEALKVFLTSD